MSDLGMGPPAADATPAVGTTPLDRARAGLDACVHCGFCLQACPTYLALEDENDSPRGRLVLMRALLDGTLSSEDPSIHTHIDRCLGCRACETACPSGVPYGELLEATRATLVEQRPIPLAARAILNVFAHPHRLTIAMAMGRALRESRIAALLGKLPGRIGFAMAMLASTARRPRRRLRRTNDRVPGSESDARAVVVAATTVPETATGAPAPRGRAALLRGCVMEGLFREINRTTLRLVRAAGYDVVEAPGQGCCGALHAHAGDLDAARALARINVAAFAASGASVIVTNAAGCGAMLESYGHLLADEPEWAARAATVARAACDVSEVVAPSLIAPAAGEHNGSARSRLRVAYDPPCHLLHAQRVAAPPLAMLAATPGIDLVPLDDADQCCGAAGIYNLLQPAVSELVLSAKLAHISESGAACVVTGNPGCLMQIGAGLRRVGSRTQVRHPVELLDTDTRLDRARRALTGREKGEEQKGERRRADGDGGAAR